jgi:hypothetical protein
MQRTILYPLTVLILLTITATCYSQNIFWLSGSWQGKAYFPGSAASQNYSVLLKVYNIKGNKFEGIITIMQPSDTSVRFDSRISGTVYNTYLIIKREKILYIRNAPNIQWKVSCNNCSPPHMFFSIKKGKFFFGGEQEDCYKECNGITEFSKDMTEFDSSAKESIYALINGPQKPEITTASIAENKPPKETTASLSQEENPIAQRIILIPAGPITLTEHNTTSLLLPKTTSSLQKHPFVVIKASEPKRIPVLAAGAIVLSKHNTSLLLPQKLSFSLQRTRPSIIFKEAEHKRVPVLAAGAIVLSKHNTSLLLPQKGSFSLQRTHPSMILKEAERKRVPVLPAGDIVSVKRSTNLPKFEKVSYTLQRSTPSMVIKEGTQPLAKNKIPSTVDTISLSGRKTSSLTEKGPPVIHDITPVLPAGYAERKKNIVRTLIVNTDSIVLRVYDNGVVDGDIISVIYNDQVVIDKLSLTARALEIKIPVNKTEINSLVFHAHNLGEFPPNTAKLEIIYGNKKEELTVASDLTASSTIDVVRER